MGGTISLSILSVFGRLPPAELMPPYEILHRDLEYGYEIRRYPRSRAVETEIPTEEGGFNDGGFMGDSTRSSTKQQQQKQNIFARSLTSLLNFAVKSGGDQSPDDEHVAVIKSGDTQPNLGSNFDGSIQVKKSSSLLLDEESNSNRHTEANDNTNENDVVERSRSTEYHSHAVTAMGEYYKQIYDKETQMTRVTNVMNSIFSFSSFVFRYLRPKFYRLAGTDGMRPCVSKERCAVSSDGSTEVEEGKPDLSLVRIRTYFHSPIFFPHRLKQENVTKDVEEFDPPIFDDWMNEKERERMRKIQQLRFEEVEDPLMEKPRKPRFKWSGSRAKSSAEAAALKYKRDAPQTDPDDDAEDEIIDYGAIPKPQDPRVRLVDVPERTVAVLTLPQTNPFHALRGGSDDADGHHAIASKAVEMLRQTARITAASIEDKFINSGASLSEVLKPPGARSYDPEYHIYSDYTRRKMRRQELEKNRLYLSVDPRWWRTELVDYNPLWTLPGFRTRELHVPVQLRVDQSKTAKNTTTVQSPLIPPTARAAVSEAVVELSPSLQPSVSGSQQSRISTAVDGEKRGREIMNNEGKFRIHSAEGMNFKAGIGDATTDARDGMQSRDIRTNAFHNKEVQPHDSQPELKSAQKKKKKKIVPTQSPIATGTPLSMINFVVGTIKEVTEHPDADKLYIVNIDIGEKYYHVGEDDDDAAAVSHNDMDGTLMDNAGSEHDYPDGGGIGLGGIDDDDDDIRDSDNPATQVRNKLRTVLSGLREHYPNKEDLVGKRVIVVENLEPRKMRGIRSAGMILCGSSPTEGEGKDSTRTVRVLDIPDDVPNGERIEFPAPHNGPAAPVLKKKLKRCFEQVAPKLRTDADGLVCFGELPFMTSQGPVSCRGVPPDSPVG